MSKRLNLTDQEIETFRRLIEVENLQQQIVAQRLHWPIRRIERLIQKYHLKTQSVGPRRGSGHPEWRGGRIVDKNGYVLVYDPGNPMCRGPRGCYVLEHRKVMADHLGRPLTPKEVVHHKNRDKADNRLENLELFGSNGLHLMAELTGHCPQWTLMGKNRILQAVRASNARRRKEHGASALHKNSRRSTTHTDTATHDPSGTEPQSEPQPTYGHQTPEHATAHVSDQPADTDP